MAAVEDERQRATQLIDQWLELDLWPYTRAEAQQLLEDGLYTKICNEFDPQNRALLGPVGLQAEYGAGFTKLNELVVTQMAQAMYYYCLRVIGETEMKIHGIGIGYDSSPRAKTFAEITAGVFLSQGVRVYMPSEPVPTSWTSYINRYYMCGCGFMSTMTHTPQVEYRYIIYGIGHGSHLSAPHNAGVSDVLAEENKYAFVPWPALQSLDKILQEGLESHLLVIIDREHEVFQAYRKELSLLKYFGREYTRKTKTSFRIGCLPRRIPDHSALTDMLESLFKFSYDAIQHRFVFFKNARLESLPLDRGIAELCVEVEKMNAESSCDSEDLPPIKIVISFDFNAEEVALAELVNSMGKTVEERWKMFRARDIGLIVAKWCMENLNTNPMTLAALKERGFVPGQQFYVSSNLVSADELEAMASCYENIVSKKHDGGYQWLGSVHDNERECGAVCTLYQGISEFSSEKIAIGRDGIMLLGILAELLIDLYEFFGAGVAQSRNDRSRPRLNTLNDYVKLSLQDHMSNDGA